jgi:hypothetical protein
MEYPRVEPTLGEVLQYYTGHTWDKSESSVPKRPPSCPRSHLAIGVKVVLRFRLSWAKCGADWFLQEAAVTTGRGPM